MSIEDETGSTGGHDYSGDLEERRLRWMKRTERKELRRLLFFALTLSYSAHNPRFLASDTMLI